jgi:diguanylate cyclase (GGDEF)-like protein
VPVTEISSHTDPPWRPLLDAAFLRLGEDPAAALTEAQALLQRADVPADSTAAGLCWHLAGMASYTLGDVAQGNAAMTRAIALLDRHGPRQAACRAWSDHGSALTHVAGDVPGGVQALQRALALSEDDAHQQGLVLSRLGPAMGRLGRLDEAATVLQSAVQRLDGGPDRRALVLALDNLGFVFVQLGQHQAALQPLTRALTLIDVAGDRLHRANAETNLALALAGVGRFDEALDVLHTAGARLDPATDGYQWADHCLARARVYLQHGRAASARMALHEGLECARSNGLASAEIDLLRLLPDADEACGDLAAALSNHRALRDAERRWLDEEAASRARQLEASIELAERRAENNALARARDELEARVAERTEALRQQMQERESAEALARFWADHDWLTRLPNRRLLQVKLREGLNRAHREGRSVGVLFVDMDGFKSVNDGHGHLSGDRLLRLTARRLLRTCPADAAVTRYGGDEFVVVLPSLEDDRMPAALAHRLCQAVMQPLRLNGRRMSLSCSIGVAIGPLDASTPDELVRCADRAMLVAKASGRNQVCQLDAGGQERLDRRGRLRRELGQAIAHGGLSAVYQPVWNVREQRLAGVELLARWHDPTLGAVSPAEFIPLAEESGLIGLLGQWALRQGVVAATALRRDGIVAGRSRARVAVNLSTLQLADPDLVQGLTRLVRAAGGEPAWLELELTESLQLAEDPAVRDRLMALREAGFHLSLDDFGAGYSSFAYLGQHYFDRLKIDRALVHAAARSPERSPVTGSIVAMAHGLGLQVVAEGIETREQLALLQAQGCDAVQGWFIARPMPLEDLLVWRGPLAG